MRPVVVTATLLVVLMFMSDSAAESLVEMCKNRHVAIPCKVKNSQGWFQMGNNRCVRVFHERPYLPYIHAEGSCNEYSNGNNRGHLVSIHSMDELNIVECTMYRAQTGKAHYWIGLHRSSIAGPFSWTDGTKHDFSRWAGGQPDNHWGAEDAVEMNYWSWGLWNDRRRTDALPYVCAIRV